MSYCQYKDYIENYLMPEIVKQLKNEELISYTFKNTTGDLFMTTIFYIQLKIKTYQGEKRRHLVAKFLHGHKSLREDNKAYIKFANEVYFYSTIMPCYRMFLQELNLNDNIITDFVPKVYQAKFGYIEGLISSSDQKESVLVMENLSYMGYQEFEDFVFLDRQHLLVMCEALGKLHGVCYAFKALKPLQMENLVEGIIPQPPINENDSGRSTKNHFRALYRCGFHRLWKYYERKVNDLDTKSLKDLKFMQKMVELKAQYYEEPFLIVENITKICPTDEDRHFFAILQGDFYGNSVLFKYSEEEERVQMKMSNFQKLCYGSPCLDLSCFMFVNTTQELRAEMWSCLLETYHSNMFSCLSKILEASSLTNQKMTEILNAYSKEKFLNHFKRFGLYGAIICLHYLPWSLCSPEECTQFIRLYETDVNGMKFYKHSLTAGGDEVNQRIWDVIRHACEMGLMDDL